jgi:predicted RNA-binding protein
MAYWLCITTKENWDVIKKKNVWGVQERHVNTIGRVKKGDRCLIYVMSYRDNDNLIPPKIVAKYEVVSDVYKDTSKIFKNTSGQK